VVLKDEQGDRRTIDLPSLKSEVGTSSRLSGTRERHQRERDEEKRGGEA
jgi:hypothetical protein